VVENLQAEIIQKRNPGLDQSSEQILVNSAGDTNANLIPAIALP
jgi:hypothetical protein